MLPSAANNKRDARNMHHPIVHLKELGIESRTMRAQPIVINGTEEISFPFIYEDEEMQFDPKESDCVQPQRG